ncbi:MAG: hypothetical protein A2Y10_13185 [Planctomycetes bacterium GWF2_41_51]|nr:MAG: hypothetical protein A2Y10_13185 [Planctomycetes bacterium GWF2_41_51]HBG60690.1 hypothetical protein [Candidatus Omnitrophota bacterium]
MNPLNYLLGCFLYFICVGLDIAMFFLQIRLIQNWKTVSWLVPFDNAGKFLVDAISMKVSGYLKTQNQLSERGKLIIALIAFALLKIILVSVINAK